MWLAAESHTSQRPPDASHRPRQYSRLRRRTRYQEGSLVALQARVSRTEGIEMSFRACPVSLEPVAARAGFVLKQADP